MRNFQGMSLSIPPLVNSDRGSARLEGNVASSLRTAFPRSSSANNSSRKNSPSLSAFCRSAMKEAATTICQDPSLLVNALFTAANLFRERSFRAAKHRCSEIWNDLFERVCDFITSLLTNLANNPALFTKARRTVTCIFIVISRR